MAKIVGKHTSGSPIGVIKPHSGATAPAGTLLCDGSPKNVADYPALFAVIQYTYGGSGSTFNLPDYRGRSAVGKDDMGGTAANRITSAGSGITGTTLGASGGAETNTLTSSQMPSHRHRVYSGSGGGTGATTLGSASSEGVAGVGGGISGKGYYDTASSSGGAAYLENSGSGTAHNNTQPSIVCNYVICYV